MARFLTAHRYRVQFDLSGSVDCIILVDPRVGDAVRFGVEEIQDYKSSHRGVCCLHRVNECDQRKGTHEMDEQLEQANQVADVTVVISQWLLDYHASRWFDKQRHHQVIYNGADPAIFHPIGSSAYIPGKTFRLVTHHWSSNWLKGFNIYQEIDHLIAERQLPDVELWVIGRWPEEIKWRAAKTCGPTQGGALANLLRQCHAYVTASQWEPGGMHHVEGAQCGLPVVYHEDGGGIVESASRYGVSFRDSVKPAILTARERLGPLRAAVLQNAPSGDQMCVDYLRVIQRLICEKEPR
jgi:glycosyltransferase involved in cell wall biosynthesis